jgi:hypothetical protein
MLDDVKDDGGTQVATAVIEKVPAQGLFGVGYVSNNK